MENVFLLRELFNRPAPLYVPGNLDKFLIGLATQPMQNTETYYTEEVFINLFFQITHVETNAILS